MRRVACFAFWSVLCFLPVAWFEGRRVYAWCIAPRIGESLTDVVSRLGVAEDWGNEALAIACLPPSWWIMPVFGQVLIWANRDGRVQRWTVSWR